MTDLLSLLVQMGGTVEADELRYQCRKRRLDMNGSLDALVEAGEVERAEDGSVRAVRQVVKRAEPRRRAKRRRRKQPVYSDPVDRRLRVASLWRAGEPVAKIAVRLGVSPSVVNRDVRWLRAQGHDLPHRQASADEARERRTVICVAWRNGATLREIAQALELSVGAVGAEISHMRKAGVDLPYRRASAPRARVLSR